MGEELAGRVVIVTGGSQGVGIGIVRAFLDEGASVVTCARKSFDDHPAARDQADRARLLHVPADIRDDAQIDAVIAAALQRFGRIDVLVNNAYTGAAGKTANVETGAEGTPADIARQYKAEGQGWVFVGDQNVGEGSSREHAAMSPRWMGCRVAIARSFARIHHTNLKKQGVLPMTFANPADYDLIEPTDRFTFHNLKDLKPGSQVKCTVTHADGSTVDITLNHTFNNEQLVWFQQGSALNALKAKAA